MRDSFCVLDLTSQGVEIQRLLSGHSEQEKLAWLVEHGDLTPIPISDPSLRPCYRFTSRVGVETVFFFDGEEFVFLGDHTTFTVKKPEAESL